MIIESGIATLISTRVAACVFSLCERLDCHCYELLLNIFPFGLSYFFSIDSSTSNYPQYTFATVLSERMRASMMTLRKNDNRRNCRCKSFASRIVGDVETIDVNNQRVLCAALIIFGECISCAMFAR